MDSRRHSQRRWWRCGRAAPRPRWRRNRRTPRAHLAQSISRRSCRVITGRRAPGGGVFARPSASCRTAYSPVVPSPGGSRARPVPRRNWRRCAAPGKSRQACFEQGQLGPGLVAAHIVRRGEVGRTARYRPGHWRSRAGGDRKCRACSGATPRRCMPVSSLSRQRIGRDRLACSSHSSCRSLSMVTQKSRSATSASSAGLEQPLQQQYRCTDTAVAQFLGLFDTGHRQGVRQGSPAHGQ